jgi:hypothetical protein
VGRLQRAGTHVAVDHLSCGRRFGRRQPEQLLGKELQFGEGVRGHHCCPPFVLGVVDSEQVLVMPSIPGEQLYEPRGR